MTGLRRMATRVAIYEPDPRICGPDEWANAMRHGFRSLGHECDIVTSTKSGRRPVRWGRIVRHSGSSHSCALVPDSCVRHDDVASVLASYDLVLITDVKTATCDNEAFDAHEPEPSYVRVLRECGRPFASALHGKWYFDRNEVPTGASVRLGSPYIGALLGLDNFSGMLLDHGRDDAFVASCARLRDPSLRRRYVPLPYVVRYTDDEVAAVDALGICTLGRVTPTKMRQLVNAVVNSYPGWQVDVTYAGTCSVQHGPSDSFRLFEQMTKAYGWEGRRDPHPETGADGAKSSLPWECWRDGQRVRYTGLYEHGSQAALGHAAHVGMTNCNFSGGLLEFSTLEAIDGGCVPVVTRPFVPVHDYVLSVVEYPLASGFGLTNDSPCRSPCESHRDWPSLREMIREAIDAAVELRRGGAWRHNRETLRREHDPRVHAQVILDECL